MKNKDEALKMAIEAMEDLTESLTEKNVWYSIDVDLAIQACKEALAKAEQDDTEFWERLQSEVDENGY